MIIKLKVDTKREFNELYWALRKVGLLSSVSVNDITLPESCFPLEVPIDIDGLLKLTNNPLVKKNLKMIDWNLSENVKKIKPSLV